MDKKIREPAQQEEKQSKKQSVTFSKEQIVSSNKYAMYRDFLTGNLEDKAYTFEEVDSIIEKFKKGQVK